MYEDIKHIVGEDHVDCWVALKPKIYYRDGISIGVIATRVIDGETLVAASMKEADVIFPLSMLRDILKISHKTRMTAITDVKAFHRKIQLGLAPHGYKFYIDGDTMYSRNNYKGRNDEMD